MFNRLRYIVLLAIVLLGTIQVLAQMSMPDYVYIGATKHYNVDPNPTATYTWWIDGIQQVGVTSNAIDITWTTSAPNPHKLEVQEHTPNGCDGQKRSGDVFVSELPTLPDPFTECVENLISVNFNPATGTVDYQQPDFYTFTQSDARLDLVNFTSNGSPDCPFKIGWRIDFSPASDPSHPHDITTLPSVTGTGQPSTFGVSIHLPGNGLEYTDVTHTITYWIEDCNGNHINELGNQSIIIKPRPKIE